MDRRMDGQTDNRTTWRMIKYSMRKRKPGTDLTLAELLTRVVVVQRS